MEGSSECAGCLGGGVPVAFVQFMVLKIDLEDNLLYIAFSD
jgi:hypothetical protein